MAACRGRAADIVGNLRRTIAAGDPSAVVYDIGTAIAYTPLEADVDGSGGTTGSLTASTNGSVCTNIAGSGLNTARDVERCWTLTPVTAALGGRSYKLKTTFVGSDVPGAANVNNFEFRRRDTGTGIWSAPSGGVYTRTSTSLQYTNFTSFSNFAVGEPTCTAPSVTTQPTNQPITYGANASFTALASGSPAPTVQWERSTNGGGTWSPLAGETSTTLNVTTPSVVSPARQYRAVFTNFCGSATSTAATLNITPKNLTISGAVANNKVYDGNNTATVNFGGASLVGVISPDVVTIDGSGHAATFEQEHGHRQAGDGHGIDPLRCRRRNTLVSRPTGLTARTSRPRT